MKPLFFVVVGEVQACLVFEKLLKNHSLFQCQLAALSKNASSAKHVKATLQWRLHALFGV